MKKVKSSKVAIALALASIPLLVGCGKGSSSNPTGYIPGTIYGGPGGCIPVNTAQIPFTGTNVNYSGQGLIAGQLPSGQSAGQMALGGGIAGGQFHGQSVDGTLMVTLNGGAPVQGPYPGYGGGNSNITGYVTISQMTQQDIMFQMGGGGYNPYPIYPQPYPTQQPQQQQACISGIAISGSIYQNTFYNTNVYLYMNGTTHGYALYF